MRKITEESIEAFTTGQRYRNSNTYVYHTGGASFFKLFDNLIAYRDWDYKVWKLSDCGYRTNTTKERLNGVLSALHSEWRIYQLKNKWYITDGCGQRKDWTGTLEVSA